MDDSNGGGGGSSGGKKPKLAVFLGSIRKTMNNGLHGEGVGGGVTSLDAGRAMTPLEQHGAGGRTGFFPESGDRWTEPLRLRRRTAARRRIGHATDNDDRQQQLPPLPVESETATELVKAAGVVRLARRALERDGPQHHQRNKKNGKKKKKK